MIVHLTEDEVSHLRFTILPIYMRTMREDIKISEEGRQPALVAQFQKQLDDAERIGVQLDASAAVAKLV